MRHIFLALGLSALSLAPVAQAGDLTIRIPVTASDVASQTALDALYDRIENAAKDVCAAQIFSPIELTHARRVCVGEVTASAIAQANIPALSAHHAMLQQAPVTETSTLASR